MMKRLIFLIMIALVALGLVACGGGETEPQTASLNFEGTDELRFIPDTASVPAGSTVEVTLNSTGALEHTWVLVPETADINSPDLTTQAINNAATDVVPGGESETITFTAPEAGTYTYVCTIPGHAPAGMVGTLTVSQ